MARLKTQLPRASPTARSGAAAIVTALSPVTSSGSEVTVAIRTMPIQLRDRPVSDASASP